MGGLSQRRLVFLGAALTLAGLALSAIGFSYLHSVEFGPSGYLCPAYVCTLDALLHAGYGWLLVLSYGGIVAFATGVIALGAALFGSRSS